MMRGQGLRLGSLCPPRPPLLPVPPPPNLPPPSAPQVFERSSVSPLPPTPRRQLIPTLLSPPDLGPPRGSAPGPTWKVTGCPPPLTALSLPVPPRFLSSLLTLTRQSVSRARVPPLPQPHPVTTPLQAQEHHPSFPLETPAAWHLVAPWVCISLQA